MASVFINLLKDVLNVSASHKKDTIVHIGLVHTITKPDGSEVWWCDNWKALWDNSIQMLWHKESQ